MILAVILGSAVNNDGGKKVGFTAPSVQGQSQVIHEALAMAEVDAESIGYVEAHGTATPLGDSIEVTALTEAFRSYTSRSKFCALGSLKTNVGHLDEAAGVAGLIKTVLALQHAKIPPSLHFERANPELKLRVAHFTFLLVVAGGMGRVVPGAPASAPSASAGRMRMLSSGKRRHAQDAPPQSRGICCCSRLGAQRRCMPF